MPANPPPAPPRDTPESVALLPCPFCGGPAELWPDRGGRFTAWVACMGRCCVLVSREHKTDEEAIATWNTRARPAPEAREGEATDG